MKRLLGILIDFVIVAATALGIMVYIFDFDRVMAIEMILMIVSTVMLVYGIILEISIRGTLGKVLMKKVIATDSGKRVNPFFIIIRNLIKVMIPSFVSFISAIAIGEKGFLFKNIEEELTLVEVGESTSQSVMPVNLWIPCAVLLVLIIAPVVISKENRFWHDIFTGCYVMNKDDAKLLSTVDNMTPPTIPEETPVMAPIVTGPKYYIEGVSGYFEGKRMEIGEGIVLGTDVGACNAIFPDTCMNIAREHCKVFFNEGYIWVRDLNSSYGVTLEDGVRIPSNYEGAVLVNHTFTIGYGHTFKIVKE